MDRANLISAARALLDWSQGDLHKRTGISIDNISRIEAGTQSPRPDTLNRIIGAFEEEGIEFLRNGVIKREDGYRIITGDECYIRLLEDVMQTLSADDELLIWCADDAKSPSAVNDMYRQMREKGIRMRQLVEAENLYLMGDLSEYRYLPSTAEDTDFVNVVRLSYGDKYAEVNGEESRIVIYRDKRAAQRDRYLFNVLWGCLKQPTESVADERF